MPINLIDAERLARIDEMMEKHRATKRRQVLQRAMKRWRRTEAHQQLAAFERLPTRIH